MSLKYFYIIAKLGEGAYAIVYKVCRIADGNIYALKRVKMAILNGRYRYNAVNEIRILASIRHNNVICYKQAFIDESTKYLCIVMEYASNGDLGNRIAQHQKEGSTIPERKIWTLLIEMVNGLKQLHDRSILHRDIKPANVFLDYLGVAKLGDMNVSKIAYEGLCMTKTGTPYYASPEVWKDEPYDYKSDIWSLGCVLYELIALKPPFRAYDTYGLMKKVVRGIYPRIPSEYSQDLSTMVRCLLQTNPYQRPSCDRILRMPIIQKRMDHPYVYETYQLELLRTIRVASNFRSLGYQLPKANYLPLKLKKGRGIKSLLDSIYAREMCEVESLPILDKDKKIRVAYNCQYISYRTMTHGKNSINVIRERKISMIGVSCTGLYLNSVVGHQKEIKNYEEAISMNSKEKYYLDRKQFSKSPIEDRRRNKYCDIKLPKVLSRYHKMHENVKHGSLRSHKIYGN